MELLRLMSKHPEATSFFWGADGRWHICRGGTSKRKKLSEINTGPSFDVTSRSKENQLNELDDARAFRDHVHDPHWMTKVQESAGRCPDRYSHPAHEGCRGRSYDAT